MPNIVKITTKFNPFDLLVPHICRGCGRTGNVLCDRCKKNIYFLQHNFCPICKHLTADGKCQNHPNLPPAYVLGYRHGLLDQLIHEYKYDSVRSLSRPLAELLNQILPEINTTTYLVPLPTINRHIRERGQDHTLRIAKNLVKYRPSWHVSKLLIRASDTVQVGTDRRTRLAQASSAYQINPKITINPDATYILFDDVWTTGASMSAAIKKLRQSGVKNLIIAILAVSEL